MDAAIPATVSLLLNGRTTEFPNIAAAAATMSTIMAVAIILFRICLQLVARRNLSSGIQLMPFPVVCEFPARTDWHCFSAAITNPTAQPCAD